MKPSSELARISLVKNKRNQAKLGVVTSDGSGKQRRSGLYKELIAIGQNPTIKV